MAFLQQPRMAPPQSAQISQPSQASRSESAFFSQRSRRQLGLFVAGVGFFAMSTAITRRSIIRRYKASIPKFYQPSTQPNNQINGALEAFEALNVATINVLSVSMMVSGGLLWAFDISSLDDMRRKVRTNMGLDTLPTDQDADEEIEEFIATILARKEFKTLMGGKELKSIKEKNDKDQEKES